MKQWLLQGVFGLMGSLLASAELSPSVFELPVRQARYVALQRESQIHFKSQDYVAAERTCRDAMSAWPFDATAPYNLACALAKQGKSDDAISALETAVGLGFNQAVAMSADADLSSLRELPRFLKAIQDARSSKPNTNPELGWKYETKPNPLENGIAIIGEGNTQWDQRIALFRAFFDTGNPANAESPLPRDVVVGMGEAGALVRQWFTEGTAAGNLGDLYDNRDSDHSNMHFEAFPQLTRLEYDRPAQNHQSHYGVQLSFLFNAPTLGNSSTAVTGAVIWRSQPRFALTQPLGAQKLMLQYLSNHLYVYPEHRDHDPGQNGKLGGEGYGDVFPANTPYYVVSQGSSGSDVVFLDAIALTMAAFRPDVKKKLVQQGLLAPTLQMILRKSNRHITGPEAYFSGEAHPTVFEQQTLQPQRMVQLAQDMLVDQLPPVVQLQVKEESMPRLGIDLCDAQPSERLLDTPFAIARIAKSMVFERRMVVSAAASVDPQGLPLKFRWAVLRGLQRKIQIRPLNESGNLVEILLKQHPRLPVIAGSKVESNRVDIGVFANNGFQDSAPSFISYNFLDNQHRIYDAQGRILVADYSAPEVRDNYVDPLLDAGKNWRDEFHYDDDGELRGWTRKREALEEEFSRDGHLVLQRDAKGRPLQVRGVRYLLKAETNETRHQVEQVLSEERFRYDYRDAEDRIGTLKLER